MEGICSTNPDEGIESGGRVIQWSGLVVEAGSGGETVDSAEPGYLDQRASNQVRECLDHMPWLRKQFCGWEKPQELALLGRLSLSPMVRGLVFTQPCFGSRQAKGLGVRVRL